MKRFWVVLLTLGLIAVFGTTVFAVDVKFSGEYYAAGMYLDKTSLKKDVAGDSTSTAFYFQRLRVRTDYIVSPGLSLITRFDAMERAWGAARSAPGTAQAADSAGTRAENENIAFDWAYIEYKSPIGIFSAGYMNDGSTGTVFGDSYGPKGRIKYSYTFVPVTINLAYTKEKEASNMATGATTIVDTDNDKYGVEGIFRWKTGRAGMQVNYYNFAGSRSLLVKPFKRKYFLFTPYVIAQFGPVVVQAEFNYAMGDDKYEDGGVTPDVKIQNYTGWVDATADFGMVYAGGSIAYVSGDDPATKDKSEGGIINGGRDWNPCLIMWNYDRTNWAGGLAGWDGTNQDTAMANGWFAQIRGGVRPVEKLDIMASLSWAHADKTLSNQWEGRDYGYEVDLTATYKITNNLSYMLGGGYLFAGDWYKGINAGGTNKIQNDFMVINKLTLTF